MNIIETLKRPLRRIKRLLTDAPAVAPAKAPRPSILDSYTQAYPTDQEAINIFRGEWSSTFPEAMQLQAGNIPLFNDDRIQKALAALGGVAGMSVLELGPLEGGHSYQLEQAGAASVLAIEANSRAYLKCLIAKEITGMKKVRFMHGDFLAYLHQKPPRFDFVLASGVLYHQDEPMELISLLAAITDRVLVWTHYFDEEIVRASANLSTLFKGVKASTFGGFSHTLHRQEYQGGLQTPGFCGAGSHHTHWMERDELLQAWRHAGFGSVEIVREDRQFANGPNLLLAVTR